MDAPHGAAELAARSLPIVTLPPHVSQHLTALPPLTDLQFDVRSDCFFAVSLLPDGKLVRGRTRREVFLHRVPGLRECGEEPRSVKLAVAAELHALEPSMCLSDDGCLFVVDNVTCAATAGSRLLWIDKETLGIIDELSLSPRDFGFELGFDRYSTFHVIPRQHTRGSLLLAYPSGHPHQGVLTIPALRVPYSARDGSGGRRGFGAPIVVDWRVNWHHPAFNTPPLLGGAPEENYVLHSCPRGTWGQLGYALFNAYERSVRESVRTRAIVRVPLPDTLPALRSLNDDIDSHGVVEVTSSDEHDFAAVICNPRAASLEAEIRMFSHPANKFNGDEWVDVYCGTHQRRRFPRNCVGVSHCPRCLHDAHWLPDLGVLLLQMEERRLEVHERHMLNPERWRAVRVDAGAWSRVTHPLTASSFRSVVRTLLGLTLSRENNLANPWPSMPAELIEHVIALAWQDAHAAAMPPPRQESQQFWSRLQWNANYRRDAPARTAFNCLVFAVAVGIVLLLLAVCGGAVYSLFAAVMFAPGLLDLMRDVYRAI